MHVSTVFQILAQLLRVMFLLPMPRIWRHEAKFSLYFGVHARSAYVRKNAFPVI